MWVADLAMNVPSHLNCLNKRLSTPLPQSSIAAAAAEGFTQLYNGFIEEKNLRATTLWLPILYTISSA